MGAHGSCSAPEDGSRDFRASSHTDEAAPRSPAPSQAPEPGPGISGPERSVALPPVGITVGHPGRRDACQNRGRYDPGEEQTSEDAATFPAQLSRGARASHQLRGDRPRAGAKRMNAKQSLE